jgi:transposase
LLAEIGDFNRFNNDDEYCSYLGIVPSERSSGDSLYYRGMQSRCNKHLRPLLIEAAWQAIRKSPALLQYYRKHIGRGNTRAIVKVAAKLALIAKAVVIKETQYIEKI